MDLLTDEQVRSLALGNWFKLNLVLRAKPELSELRRMLALELSRKHPRANMALRLRKAINRAEGNAALATVREFLKEPSATRLLEAGAGYRTLSAAKRAFKERT